MDRTPIQAGGGRRAGRLTAALPETSLARWLRPAGFWHFWANGKLNGMLPVRRLGARSRCPQSARPAPKAQVRSPIRAALPSIAMTFRDLKGSVDGRSQPG